MKNAFRILIVTVIALIVFWPWLLNWIDLVWLVLYQKPLTYGYWWDAMWSNGGYRYWPYSMLFVMAAIFGVWFAVGMLFEKKE